MGVWGGVGVGRRNHQLQTHPQAFEAIFLGGHFHGMSEDVQIERSGDGSFDTRLESFN